MTERNPAWLYHDDIGGVNANPVTLTVRGRRGGRVRREDPCWDPVPVPAPRGSRLALRHCRQAAGAERDEYEERAGHARERH